MAKPVSYLHGLDTAYASSKRPGNAFHAARIWDETLRKFLYWDGDRENWFAEDGGAMYSILAPRQFSDDFQAGFYASYVVGGGSSGTTPAVDNAIAAATATTLTDNGGGTADGTVAAQAAPVTLTDSTGTGSHDDTIAAATLPAAMTDSSGGVDPGNNIIAAITDPATVCQITTLFNVATAGAAAAQKDISACTGGETMAGLAQPSHPRNITITVTDGNTSISAFTITVVGTAPDGTVINEAFTFAGGLIQTGSKIFATLTSITLTSITGNGAGDTLDAAWGVKLGLPVLYGSTGLSIKRLVVDGTAEAATATDTTNNSFTATSAPNNNHDYEVWFTVVGPSTTTIKAAIAQLAAKQNTATTALGVLKQNDADIAQKVIELVTLAGVAQNNLKEVTTQLNAVIADVADIRTKYNAARTENTTVRLITGATGGGVAADASYLSLPVVDWEIEEGKTTLEAKLQLSAITDVYLFFGLTDTLPSGTLELPINLGYSLVETLDGGNALGTWALNGLSTANSNGGILYAKYIAPESFPGTGTVELYKASNLAANSKVATGSGTIPASSGSVTITLTAANTSGLTGSVVVQHDAASDASVTLTCTETYTTTATDAVGFLFDTAGIAKYWRAAGVAAGTDATHVTTTSAPVAATYAVLKIVVETDGTAKFYVDGTLVGTVANAVTPGTALVPLILANANGAAARTVTVDYWHGKTRGM